MNKRNNSLGTLIGVVIAFAIVAAIVGAAYKIGLNRPPLKYANIPEQTLKFLDLLGKSGMDMGVVPTEDGPFDWDNDDDLGCDPSWSKEEDANFIVYYHKDPKAVWQERAKYILAEANHTIPDLIDLMGAYYYPDSVNGRKLPIYLPNTIDDYSNSINSLIGQTCNSEGSIGMYCSSVGPTGCKTLGIVIHPSCFEAERESNGYHQTLRHEMNHYVFFSSLNYGKSISHYLWMSEGLARYFQTSDHPKVTSADSIQYINQNCLLNGEFPRGQNAEYWAGESFYVYLEGKFGLKFIKHFISTAYQYSTDSTFVVNKMDQAKIHTSWVNYLSNAATQPASTEPLDNQQ